MTWTTAKVVDGSKNLGQIAQIWFLTVLFVPIHPKWFAGPLCHRHTRYTLWRNHSRRHRHYRLVSTSTSIHLMNPVGHTETGSSKALLAMPIAHRGLAVARRRPTSCTRRACACQGLGRMTRAPSISLELFTAFRKDGRRLGDAPSRNTNGQRESRMGNTWRHTLSKLQQYRQFITLH